MKNSVTLNKKIVGFLVVILGIFILSFAALATIPIETSYPVQVEVKKEDKDERNQREKDEKDEEKSDIDDQRDKHNNKDQNVLLLIDQVQVNKFKNPKEIILSINKKLYRVSVLSEVEQKEENKNVFFVIISLNPDKVVSGSIILANVIERYESIIERLFSF